MSMGDLVLLVSLYVAWLPAAAIKASAKVANENQTTERFTRTIEQLASGPIATRLGALYPLERIARAL